ncbi:hypothetical protein J7I93_03750 [Bacillus sp. ISL-47]|uniref:hypothetical protein n=1 Tax=Bacillus sp. ISL-47 TaxID=2819130 RepID=UPI001BEC5401|nr:hypothetical protein [Bacillus sp. ISL-47]MBT2687291.1 hypothetical protein [Bacillus sp. ISL-47]MBT2706639.1 hypothetical protein [Pseudomonas sp. ISL-84]
MTEQEAILIFKEIVSAYQNFDVTEDKFNYWIEHLMKMPYGPVLYKLRQHVYSSQYPPTLSQIQVTCKPENTFLKKIEERKKHLNVTGDESK